VVRKRSGQSPHQEYTHIRADSLTDKERDLFGQDHARVLRFGNQDRDARFELGRLDRNSEPPTEPRLQPVLETLDFFRVPVAGQNHLMLPFEQLIERELEGALRRVIANSRFTGHPITVEFTKEALKDLLSSAGKLVTIENIQKTVADYYKVRMADLLSKRRSRSVARPRQVAMALAKELTSHSLPEIGDAFGGRDHTTVLHACKRIKALRDSEQRMTEDYSNLLRTLTG
jgi:hypothetical protein